MSYIHYKLITNQNYEKITFDGVSLNVNELKKLILEKKFRKSMNSSAAAAHNSNSLAGAVVSAAQLRKMFDVDLEITNVDTNEVYKNDNDSIPKNSRVQIKRVVRNSGPALAGGTITQTHQESERLNSIRLRQQQERERSISSQLMHQSQSAPSQRDENSSASSSPLIDDLGPISNDLKSNVVEQQKSDPTLLNDSSNLLYSDFFNPLDSNASAATASKSPSANNSFSDILTDDSHLPPTKTIIEVGAKSISNSQVLPPVELLCPFEDPEKKERHLIRNAVIIPCCGYFICCENCIREKLQKNICIECPYETCLQEITSNHRLTPYKPTREKVNAYLARVGDEAPSVFSSSLFEIDAKEHPVMKLAPSNIELAPAIVDTKLKPSQVSGLKIIVKTTAIAINCSPTPALSSSSSSAPIEKLDENNGTKNEQSEEQEAEKLDLGIAESPKSIKSVSDVSETSSHKSSKRSSRSSSSDSSSSSRSSSTSSSTSSSSSSRSSVSSKDDAETNKEEVKKTEKTDDSKQRSDLESKTVNELNHASIQPSNPDNSSISNSFTHNQQFQINRNLNRPGASAAAHPAMLATAQQPMYQDAASHLNQQPFRYIHPNQMMQATPMNAYQNPAAFDYNQAAAAANYQQYGAHYQEPYMNHSGFIRAPYQAPMMPAHYMQGQPRFQPNQNFNPYVQQQAMQQPPMQYVNTPNGVIRVMANGYAAQPPPFNYQGGMFPYQGQMNPMHSQVPHQQLPPTSMYDTSSSHNNRLAMPHSSQHHHIQHPHATDKRDSSTYAKRSRSRSRSRSPKHHRSGKTQRSSRSPTSRHYKAPEHSSSSSQHHRSSYKERDERSRRSKTKKRHSRSRSKSYRSRSRSRSRRDDELRREKRHRVNKRFKEDKSKSRSTSRNRSPGRTHRNSSRPSQEALSSQTAHRPLSTLDMPVSHTDSNPRSSSPSGREQKQSKTSERKSNGTSDESRKEETVNTKENDEAYNKERAYQKLSNRLFKNSRRRESIQTSQVEIPVGLEEQKVEEENSLELKSQLSTDSSDDPNKNRIVILLKDKTETVKSSSSSMQIKPVKSTSHSTISNIKITVHNQKETTTNGASKPVSTPTTPTKKSTPKRRVYMNQQLISSPQKIASILPSKTTTAIVTPTLVKQESTLEEENKSPIDDEKSRPAFEEENKDDSDDLRPISSTSTNTEEEYLDISIDEKDTSIIV